jgi:hypothetical protein
MEQQKIRRRGFQEWAKQEAGNLPVWISLSNFPDGIPIRKSPDTTPIKTAIAGSQPVGRQ